MMLHLAPERVRVDLAERGVIDPVATLLPTLVRRGWARSAQNGVLGNPLGASAAEGARLVEGLVTAAVAAYDHCRAAISGTSHRADGWAAATSTSTSSGTTSPGR